MGWVTHDVNEKQLGDIPVLEFIIILLEKRSREFIRRGLWPLGV